MKYLQRYSQILSNIEKSVNVIVIKKVKCLLWKISGTTYDITTLGTVARVSFERVLVCLWSFNDWNRPKLKYASVLAQSRVTSTELTYEDRKQVWSWSRDRCSCKCFFIIKRSLCYVAVRLPLLGCHLFIEVFIFIKHNFNYVLTTIL